MGPISREEEANAEEQVHAGADHPGAAASRERDTVVEIVRKLGVTETTFYRWKKHYAGLDVSELRELKQLRDENRKLKQIVADLTLDKTILRDALGKKG